MEIVTQFDALSHPARLAVFQLLMRRYPDAVPAGEIADALSLKANTASSYLSALTAAGLITQTRHGVSLKYAIRMPSVRTMMDDLFAGCCLRRPDLCPPVSSPSEWKTDMGQTPFHVLFVCTGNSARSIMAESILNAEGGGRFRAFSAGTHPQDAPNPVALETLSGKGHDISGLHSKNLDRFSGPDAVKLNFVFTVCDQAANEPCPVWPGQPMSAHWGLPDPSKVTGTEAEKRLAFQQAYGVLLNRIKAFTSLPFETLSRIQLQHSVDDIAQGVDARQST